MSKKLLAVVTGATSGIGAALAHALAARGMDLIVIARRNERLEAIKAHLDGLDGITVRTICADLTDDDALRQVENALRDERIDLLVNSAGFGTYADFAGIDAERIKNELMLDLVVPVALTRAVLPAMLKLLGRSSPVSTYRLRSAMSRMEFTSENRHLLDGWQPKVGLRGGIHKDAPPKLKKIQSLDAV